jgi:arginine decarboxylase
MIPTKVFLTRGVGRHREMLQSFELALREAGIAMLNLVSV